MLMLTLPRRSCRPRGKAVGVMRLKPTNAVLPLSGVLCQSQVPRRIGFAWFLTSQLWLAAHTQQF